MKFYEGEHISTQLFACSFLRVVFHVSLLSPLLSISLRLPCSDFSRPRCAACHRVLAGWRPRQYVGRIVPLVLPVESARHFPPLQPPLPVLWMRHDLRVENTQALNSSSNMLGCCSSPSRSSALRPPLFFLLAAARPASHHHRSTTGAAPLSLLHLCLASSNAYARVRLLRSLPLVFLSSPLFNRYKCKFSSKPSSFFAEASSKVSRPRRLDCACMRSCARPRHTTNPHKSQDLELCCVWKHRTRTRTSGGWSYDVDLDFRVDVLPSFEHFLECERHEQHGDGEQEVDDVGWEIGLGPGTSCAPTMAILVLGRLLEDPQRAEACTCTHHQRAASCKQARAAWVSSSRLS